MRERGFSLLEVLVSLLLLSMTLLGLDALQIYALNRLNSIGFFHEAVNQLENMAERLRDAGAADLTEAIANWNQQNQFVLPNGRGEIAGEFPDFMLSIYWGKPQNSCKKNHIGVSGCLTEVIRAA